MVVKHNKLFKHKHWILLSFLSKTLKKQKQVRDKIKYIIIFKYKVVQKIVNINIF